MEHRTEDKHLEGEVWVEITGGQGEITTRTTGQCYRKNKSFYVLFQEGIEEDNRENAIPFSSRLKISQNQVILRRSMPGQDGKAGKVAMEMVYQKQAEDEAGCIVDYPTPYGVLHLEIRTDKLVIRETEDEVKIDIHYRLLQENREISEDGLVIRIYR